MGKKICDKTMCFWPVHIDFVENQTIKMKLKNRYLLRIKAADAGPVNPVIFKDLYRQMMKFRP